jgi:NADH-quinone oxidoreductase subunit H
MQRTRPTSGPACMEWVMRPKALLLHRSPILLLLAVISLTLSCHNASLGTNLLTLTGFSPKQVGVGDEIEIQGNGLPEGKPARVAFHGDLYRPGNRVERDVEIVARTTTSSPRSLSVAMVDALRAAFAGKGDEAKHTTFRGDIEVSFAPKKTGSAPVVGTLSDVVLDVDAPLVSETLQRQRDEDAAQALGFLGITLRGMELGECCVVGGVEGRAQATGLIPGDLLVDLDGVTVRSPYDLVPGGRSRVVRLTYRRGGTGPFITRELDVQGYRSAAPSELGPAVGLVGFFALCLLLTGTRFGRPLEWSIRWLALRLREAELSTLPSLRRGVKRRGWLRPGLVGLPDEAGWGLLSVMSLIAVSAAVTLIGLRVDLASSELDLTLWVVLQTASVIWAAVLAKIALSSRSTLAAAAAASYAAIHQVPLLALAATVVLSTRSLRFVDLVAAQGPSLQSCYVLRSPPLMLLTVLAIVALVPEVAPPEPAHADRGRCLALTKGLSRLLSGTVHLWSATLLITLLAFGGYRVPFVSDTLQSSSYPWQLVGVAVWFTKAACLVATVAALRGISGTISMRDTSPTLLKYGIGLVGAGVSAAELWSLLARRYALGWIEDVTAWVLLLTTVAALGWVIGRAVRLARSNRTELLPNPWL